MRTRRLGILLGVAVAVVAAFELGQFRAPLPHDWAQLSEARVVLAGRDIPAGTPVKLESLTVGRLLKRGLTDSYIRVPDSEDGLAAVAPVGRTTRVRLRAGNPLLSTELKVDTDGGM